MCRKLTCLGDRVFLRRSSGVPFVCGGRPWTDPKISSHHSIGSRGSSITHAWNPAHLKKPHAFSSVGRLHLQFWVTEYLIWIPHTAYINSCMHFPGSLWHNFVINVKIPIARTQDHRKKTGNLSNFKKTVFVKAHVWACKRTDVGRQCGEGWCMGVMI